MLGNCQHLLNKCFDFWRLKLFNELNTGHIRHTCHIIPSLNNYEWSRRWSETMTTEYERWISKFESDLPDKKRTVSAAFNLTRFEVVNKMNFFFSFLFFHFDRVFHGIIEHLPEWLLHIIFRTIIMLRKRGRCFRIELFISGHLLITA